MKIRGDRNAKSLKLYYTNFKSFNNKNSRISWFERMLFSNLFSHKGQPNDENKRWPVLGWGRWSIQLDLVERPKAAQLQGWTFGETRLNVQADWRTSTASSTKRSSTERIKARFLQQEYQVEVRPLWKLSLSSRVGNQSRIRVYIVSKTRHILEFCSCIFLSNAFS